MRSLFFILFFISFLTANGQNISSIAGNGIPGDGGNGGPATAATLNQPFACAYDSHGNFYFTEVEGVVVRKIDTSGVISLFAGGGSSLGDGGPATNAQFSDPTGIAIDAYNNVYIADLTDYRVRKIDAITGIISTVAGNGTSGYGGDNGPATAALISTNNICLDQAGNMYLNDAGNSRIRKVNASGVISTYAGNGIGGYYGDNGSATSAEVSPLIGICTDPSNNVYFVQDNSIRKISATGIITTFAGTGSTSTYGDGGPATAAGIVPYMLFYDKYGNLFISGYSTNIVRKIDAYGYIYRVAGDGANSFSGDNGPATDAGLHTPIGIAADSCGNLLIADRDDNHIRKVTFNPACWPAQVGTVTISRELAIYPNPITDELEVSAPTIIGALSITNISGQLLYEKQCLSDKAEIDIHSLPPGVYLLNIIDEYGNKTTKKIVKE